jgi:hypothetical protein
MRTTWSCPRCPMSSTRHWNVRCHISRIHDGVGEPTSGFMMRQYDRNPHSTARGFNYSRPTFHRSGSASHFYSQDRTSTKEQRSKTLIQSMDEFMEPIKKLVEYINLLNQLRVLDQQQQARRQFFYPTIIPSPEFERYKPPTSAHPTNRSLVPDFYGHIKAMADKFALH